MGFSLFPRNDRFFDLFAQSASNIRVGAEQLLNMVQDFNGIEEKAHRLKQVESTGDSITHELIDFLNSSFITPIDREDIYALAGKLDDVLDEIEGVGSRLHLFNLKQATPQCVELVRIVVRATEIIESAIRNLKKLTGLKEFLVEIHRLENQADEITRAMVAKLFQESNGNVVDLIKWKEIYARLEHTADRCEDVANVIEDIMVKNA
jgi:predicted phosphate transport protein (TIGR00153 family)